MPIDINLLDLNELVVNLVQTDDVFCAQHHNPLYLVDLTAGKITLVPLNTYAEDIDAVQAGLDTSDLYYDLAGALVRVGIYNLTLDLSNPFSYFGRGF